MDRDEAGWIVDTIAEQRAEIERLQEAKRRALAIADERSKENVALRAALRRIRAKADAGHATDNNLNQIGHIADEALSNCVDEDARPGDLLRGAARIAEFMTSLGVPTDEDDVYYAVRAKKLPIGKYGADLIASKTRLARHVNEISAGTAQRADRPVAAPRGSVALHSRCRGR